jgi:hypothetical protein
MRRQIVALTFVGLTVLVISTVASSGYAIPEATNGTPSAAPVAVQRVAMPATGLRDEAAMVLIGTALIGLAGAVRRAA